MKTVGILYGGKSSEHEVSIRSAFSVMKGIDYDKYQIIPIYINMQGEWLKGGTLSAPPVQEKDLRFLSGLPFDVLQMKKTMDVAFPLTHGPNGEDGTLQGLLEMSGVAYVGCGVSASSLGMDKVLMKTIFASAGLPQCPFLSFHELEFKRDISAVIERIEEELHYPVFVKPACLGSSVGISKVAKREDLKKALDLASSYDRKVVVEAFVRGRELEIGVLGNDYPITSEVGEVSTTSDFYDYETKYNKPDATKIDIPAQIPNSIKKEISDLAIQAFAVLGCRGLSRIDFFWDDVRDELYINEINTLPGFTPSSMFPALFQAAGVSYPDLLTRLFEHAIDWKEQSHPLHTAEKLD